jgi:hypothetical protein
VQSEKAFNKADPISVGEELFGKEIFESAIG